MINRIVGAAVLLTVLMTSLLSAQENCVRGKVVDAGNPDQVLIGATVQLLVNDTFVAGVVADFDGFFKICGKPDTGTFNLQADYTGYGTYVLINIPLEIDSLILGLPAVNLFHTGIPGCVFHPVPIYESDDLTSGQTFTDRQVRRGYSGISPYHANRAARRERRAKRKAARKKRRQ